MRLSDAFEKRSCKSHRPPRSLPHCRLGAVTQKTGHRRNRHARSGKTTSGTRGTGLLDIHFNATTRLKDVPESVWTYTLGGYQVLKKWLSYRESALLGRSLTSDEAQQFTHHTRCIASILALHEELDRQYQETVSLGL